MRRTVARLLTRLAYALDLLSEDRRSLAAEESPAADAYLRAARRDRRVPKAA